MDFKEMTFKNKMCVDTSLVGVNTSFYLTDFLVLDYQVPNMKRACTYIELLWNKVIKITVFCLLKQDGYLHFVYFLFLP